MPKTPAKTATATDVREFLQRSRNLKRFTAGRSNLIFAIDATASRQPTWDLACSLQAEMFRSSESLGNLKIQLAYYRGLGELRLGDWDSDANSLARQMSRVQCEAGVTQIARLLRAALKQQTQFQARALIFIGDAVEEAVQPLQDLAGKCRLHSLPLFLFQEGSDPTVTKVFSSMAKLSGGAYEKFDHHSAERLRELLGAVARYAAGGRAALSGDQSAGARRLLSQLGD